MTLDDEQRALLTLGLALRRTGYSFVTVTPETHARVMARPGVGRSARDVFGWSRTFEAGAILPEWVDLLRAADALTEVDVGLYRSRVRFSSLGPHLCVHSAWPTVDGDAVFFGPDTYRFCAWLQRCAPRASRMIDVGCGTGIGGLVAGAGAAELVLADINPRALRFAAVNAALAGRDALLRQSDVLRSVDGDFGCIVSNPPYLVDGDARVYRDGGAFHGAELSIRIVRECLPRLRVGGRLLLYTGTAVIGGRDVFRDALHDVVDGHPWTYEELDPDVFGEELSHAGYQDVDRIAVVGLALTRR